MQRGLCPWPACTASLLSTHTRAREEKETDATSPCPLPSPLNNRYTDKALKKPLPLASLKGRDRAAADLLLAAAGQGAAALDVHVATFLKWEVGYGGDVRCAQQLPCSGAAPLSALPCVAKLCGFAGACSEWEPEPEMVDTCRIEYSVRAL